MLKDLEFFQTLSDHIEEILKTLDNIQNYRINSKTDNINYFTTFFKNVKTVIKNELYDVNGTIFTVRCLVINKFKSESNEYARQLLKCVRTPQLSEDKERKNSKAREILWFSILGIMECLNFYNQLIKIQDIMKNDEKNKYWHIILKMKLNFFRNSKKKKKA